MSDRALASRRRRFVLACALALITAAAVLFLSPLYQVLAIPLLVSDPVAGADAIVVLGGGVNPQGDPSPSTTERVLYGVGLWKEGFSPTLLLSTGSPNGVSEARAMRRVALALGVPDEAILLEDRSVNTHQNVRFVDEIFRERGWKRSIVVSSPYHMRRIWLVRQKVSRDLETLYAPVRPSEFHRPRGWSHQFRCAWTVLHEYAGIIWYRLRGLA